MDKKESQKRHAQKRFLERFGIKFTGNMRIGIINKIQRGESKFIYARTNRISIHDVNWRNKVYRVVYDKIRKQIVTVLSSNKSESDNTTILSSMENGENKNV